MTEEELMTIVNDEIVNLGIGNRRFLERHEEIVKEVERLKALSRSKEEGGGDSYQYISKEMKYDQGIKDGGV